ncbi:MAG: hypothetical protein AVDCRST_MAG89-4485, partial [uncultured Gemmatimonadetes bacterium]
GNRSSVPGNLAHAVRSVSRAAARADAALRGPRRHHRRVLQAPGAGVPSAVRARPPGRL